MKITVENLGVIKKGSVELPETGGMTIFAGANNSGKSYMSYLVYGFYKILGSRNNKKYNDISKGYSKVLKERLDDFEPLENYFINGSIKINIIDFFKRNFPNYLTVTSFALKNVAFEIFADISMDYNLSLELENPIITKSSDLIGTYKIGQGVYVVSKRNNVLTIEPQQESPLNKSEIIAFVKEFLLIKYKGNFVFFPAERPSINLFAKEILQEKSQERDELARKIQFGENIEEILNEYKNKGTFVPRYPLPVSDYIYYVNDLAFAVQQPETEFSDLADDLERVMQGKVGLSAFGDFQFSPNKDDRKLPLHLSSSLVKSLSGLVIYFRHLAKKGDVVMIDEPELNLHPENQVRLARVLAKIANRGFNLIFSTHSDYILKELSNLTIMANEFEEKADLIKKYHYDESSFLPKDKIKVYAFQNETIEEVEITEKGFDLEKIDEVISDMTQRSDDIYFSFTENMAVHE